MQKHKSIVGLGQSHEAFSINKILSSFIVKKDIKFLLNEFHQLTSVGFKQ